MYPHKSGLEQPADVKRGGWLCHAYYLCELTDRHWGFGYAGQDVDAGAARQGGTDDGEIEGFRDHDHA
jgi:hypothetical protein